VKSHVLMYHDVFVDDPDGSGFAGRGPARYKLSWAHFVAHLDAIAAAVPGPPLAVDDLRTRSDLAPFWSLTFDDGGISSLRTAEELARRGWRGHFFITTNRIGTDGFVDASAIAELLRMGHAIGSHSASHPARMSSLSFRELLTEWETSVAALSDLAGTKVEMASVPGGHYTERIASAAARVGIRYLFTSEPVETPARVDNCLVIGRFAVKHNTSVREAAAVASGRRAPWLRRYVAWNLRKPAKAIIGEGYERLRRGVFAVRSDPQRR
jgi:peptidoglycan/xylan/chitin deacetylase (PgdA/CDA1 family)